MNPARHLSRLVHRHVWQRIPRAWRRGALIGATTALAPRPQAATASYPVVVAGFLTAASGLGASARLNYGALEAAGVPVMGVDLTTQFRQDSTTIPFAFVDGREHRGPATVILHVSAPLMPLAMWWLGRAFARGKFMVGYWAWELPEAPAEWKVGLKFVHHILVPSAFTARAVRSLQPRQPIDVLLHPVALGAAPEPPPLPRDKPFTALLVFNVASSFQRKNPIAALAAFQAAFGDDPTTQLIIKLQNSASYPDGVERLRRAAQGHANIRIDDRNLSHEDMAHLYADCDVVMSLHRSEGFGLVIAEGMLAGRPVIATDWSGNTDFLSAENGMPIGCTLVPAIDPQGEYHHPSMCWAEPDVAEAAAALRRLRDDAGLRHRLGRAAHEYATLHFSDRAYTARLKSLLALP
jgi:glycosyltransferase involved in cell wall biosynthesis